MSCEGCLPWENPTVSLPIRSGFHVDDLKQHIHDTPLKFHSSADVVIVCAQACCGQKKNGPQFAPQAVASTEFLEGLRELSWQPELLQLTQPNMAEVLETKVLDIKPLVVAQTCDGVRTAVSGALKRGAFPLTIGGDHCLAIGSVSGASSVYGDNFCVIWFDAHADINTVDTSPSGNIHGMPLAFLLGICDKLEGFEHLKYRSVKPERVAWIGLRDVDSGEEEIIKAMGFKCAFTMKDLRTHGIEKILSMCLDSVNPDRSLPVHLSFDVDGCDPDDFPSTGTPVPGGVTLAEGLYVASELRKQGLLGSMDLVEVNPALGTPQDVEKTVVNARKVIYAALGRAPAK